MHFLSRTKIEFLQSNIYETFRLGTCEKIEYLNKENTDEYCKWQNQNNRQSFYA